MAEPNRTKRLRRVVSIPTALGLIILVMAFLVYSHDAIAQRDAQSQTAPESRTQSSASAGLSEDGLDARYVFVRRFLRQELRKIQRDAADIERALERDRGLQRQPSVGSLQTLLPSSANFTQTQLGDRLQDLKVLRVRLAAVGNDVRLLLEDATSERRRLLDDAREKLQRYERLAGLWRPVGASSPAGRQSADVRQFEYFPDYDWARAKAAINQRRAELEEEKAKLERDAIELTKTLSSGAGRTGNARSFQPSNRPPAPATTLSASSAGAPSRAASAQEQLDQLRSELSEIRSQIEALKEENVSHAQNELSKSIESHNQIIEFYRESLKSQRELERLTANTDERISEVFSSNQDTNRFRLLVTGGFMALVAIVIIGFYLGIRGNESLKEKVFGTDSGFQFVTLFSLVIAIILFGVTGILGDKELSALLAGLSGYILGRNNSAPRASTPSQQAKEPSVDLPSTPRPTTPA